MGGPVEGAVSLSGLGEVVRLVDLLTDYVPLDIGLVWFSLLRNSFGSTLAARSEVDGALEHLTLHGSVALVIGHRSDRFIGGQFMEVGTQTVTLCVDVREGPALEQLVIRELDTWNKICGAEAACSTWVKKLSGLRLRTILPTGIKGNLSSGQVLVGSRGQRSGSSPQKYPSSGRSARTRQTRL